MDKSYLENLSNFILHAKGHYIMISGYDSKRNKHTFMATTPIVKYLLCDMNQKILIGALSSCQLGSLFMALDYIDCGYELITINDQMILKYGCVRRRKFRSR